MMRHTHIIMAVATALTICSFFAMVTCYEPPIPIFIGVCNATADDVQMNAVHVVGAALARPLHAILAFGPPCNITLPALPALPALPSSPSMHELSLQLDLTRVSARTAQIVSTAMYIASAIEPFVTAHAKVVDTHNIPYLRSIFGLTNEDTLEISERELLTERVKKVYAETGIRQWLEAVIAMQRYFASVDETPPTHIEDLDEEITLSAPVYRFNRTHFAVRARMKTQSLLHQSLYLLVPETFSDGATCAWNVTSSRRTWWWYRWNLVLDRGDKYFHNVSRLNVSSLCDPAARRNNSTNDEDYDVFSTNVSKAEFDSQRALNRLVGEGRVPSVALREAIRGGVLTNHRVLNVVANKTWFLLSSDVPAYVGALPTTPLAEISGGAVGCIEPSPRPI